nr:hypothetical protein [Chitinimonas koreensis]
MVRDDKHEALEAARQWIAQHEVEYLLAQFVDIHGAAKTKVVPARHLDMLVHTGAGFSGYAIWGTGLARNGGDYYARADLSTLCPVPWLPGYARLVGDGHVHGQPHPLCSRVLLKTQLARLAERGWTFNTGLEPEFVLLRRQADGDYVPADGFDRLDKASYDYKALARPDNRRFLERVTEAMAAVGADVYQIDHEDATGQYEINYAYSDALKSADRYTWFKMAASFAAEEAGLLCSFMPKPFADRAGSGLHFHVSMADAAGVNLFEDDSDPQGYALSQLGYRFLAGILHHAPALTALCAPTVNSYKRLVVGNSLSGATWAPAYVAYGDNRTVLARCPAAASNGGWPTPAPIPTWSAPRSWPPASTASTARSSRASRSTTTCTNTTRAACTRPASATCRSTWARRSTRWRRIVCWPPRWARNSSPSSSGSSGWSGSTTCAM